MWIVGLLVFWGKRMMSGKMREKGFIRVICRRDLGKEKGVG